MADFFKRNKLILLLALTITLALYWLANSEKSGSQAGVSNDTTGSVVTPAEPVKENVVNSAQDPANTPINSTTTAATTASTPSSTTEAASDNSATSATSDSSAAAVEVPSVSTGQPDDDQNSSTESE